MLDRMTLLGEYLKETGFGKTLGCLRPDFSQSRSEEGPYHQFSSVCTYFEIWERNWFRQNLGVLEALLLFGVEAEKVRRVAAVERTWYI